MRVYDVLSSKSRAAGLTFDSDNVVFYTVTANVLTGVHGDSLHVSCSCPGFTYRQTCKHVDLIRSIEADPSKLDDLRSYVRLRIGSFDAAPVDVSDDFSFGSVSLVELLT